MSEFQIQSFIGNSQARLLTCQSVTSPSGPVLLSGPPGVGKYTWLMWHLEPRVGPAAVTSFDAADGIDSVREAIDSGRYATDAPYGAIVIRNLHQATDSSQDALLKSLEEPHPGTVFFLVADDVGMLRDTIMSRIRTHIRWMPLSAAELRSITTDEFAIGAAFGSAAAALGITGDQPLRALYDTCIRHDWPSVAIMSPVPAALQDVDSGSPRRLLLSSVFRAASRASRYPGQLARLASVVARIPSLNIPLHYLTAAADSSSL